MKPKTLKPGYVVRMSEPFKRKMRANGSQRHIAEFGECYGIVRDIMDWGHRIKGPEWNVFWQPSNLKYCYHPNDLVVLHPKRKKTHGKL